MGDLVEVVDLVGVGRGENGNFCPLWVTISIYVAVLTIQQIQVRGPIRMKAFISTDLLVGSTSQDATQTNTRAFFNHLVGSYNTGVTAGIVGSMNPVVAGRKTGFGVVNPVVDSVNPPVVDGSYCYWCWNAARMAM